MQFQKDITGFTGGISQQPPALRSDTQCEEMENALLSLVYGNMQRPPMEHVAVLTSLAGEGAFMHTINRDSSEKYNLIITGDATEPLEVYTLGGTKCTIRYGHLSDALAFTSDATVKSYLTSLAGKLPRQAFKATTIADHTLIVNTTKVCSMDPTVDPTTRPEEGFVIVKKGVAKTQYEVYLNGVLAGGVSTGETTDYASYNSKNITQNLQNSILSGSTIGLTAQNGVYSYLLSAPPAGSPLSLTLNGSPIDSSLWSVTNVGGQWTITLHVSLTLGYDPGGEGSSWTGYPIVITGGAIPGYSLFLQDNIIRIRRLDGAAFSLRVSDTYSNEALDAVYHKTQAFDKLPARFFADTVIEVVGDANNAFDNYWVKYEATESAGTWSETRKPGMKNNFDRTSLPHRLVRTAFNEFTFCDTEWTERKIGDEVAASEPSFIGKTINDIFYWRNRLGVFSGENHILSKASDFFNYWPTTATDSLDDDPIDVAGSTNEVVNLKFAVPYEKVLLGFGDQVQLQFNTGNAATLTPKTLVSDPATRFSITPDCKPLLVGSNIFMAVQAGETSQVREYYVQGDGTTYDAADITAHCPTYLPKNIIKFAGSSTYDLLFALSEETPNVLYVYKYYWQGDEKAQSAWSKWTFPVDILSMVLLDEYLYLTTKGSGQVTLQKINLSSLKTGTLPLICLDRRFTATGVYDVNTDLTTWSMPFVDTSSTEYVAVQSVLGFPEVILTKNEAGNSLSAPGDFSSVTFYIGTEYLWRLLLTKFILKDSNNKPYLHGHTILRTLALGYANTGYFEVRVTAVGRDTDVYPFTPFYAGSPLGSLVTPSGTFSDPMVQGDPQDIVIEIQNPTFLPSILTGASYEGTFYSRARKI